MKLEREEFIKFLKEYLDSQFDPVVDAVMNTLDDGRQEFNVHVSLQVYITDDRKPPEGMINTTGQVVIRDLRHKTQKLDERSN